ncbi:Skp1 family, dimerization domain-containing protein [Xylariaceae sp. FL0255]|nr:Skp1 family, dimerization domain-containing protein [Xylariaceae sp. FL0255]
MASQSNNPTVSVMCDDGTIFQSTLKAVKQSYVVKGMVEDLDLDFESEEEQQPIPFQQIDSEIVKKVLEFCKKHCEDPLPDENGKVMVVDEMAEARKRKAATQSIEDGDNHNNISSSSSSYSDQVEMKEVDLISVIKADDWDNEFLNVDIEVLKEIATAANYLEIPVLLNFSCFAIAMYMKGKSTEQLREILGVENDWPVGEEERLREQNAWAYDC